MPLPESSFLSLSPPNLSHSTVSIVCASNINVAFLLLQPHIQPFGHISGLISFHLLRDLAVPPIMPGSISLLSISHRQICTFFHAVLYVYIAFPNPICMLQPSFHSNSSWKFTSPILPMKKVSQKVKQKPPRDSSVSLLLLVSVWSCCYTLVLLLLSSPLSHFCSFILPTCVILNLGCMLCQAGDVSLLILVKYLVHNWTLKNNNKAKYILLLTVNTFQYHSLCYQ